LIALFTLGAGLAAAAPMPATTAVSVLTAPDIFSPQTVTVRIGDTVTWNNPTTGIHNVFSDDGTTFSSGAAVAGPWTYSFTFTTAGTFGYHCQLHGAPNSGMFGTVIVLDAIELAHGSDMTRTWAARPIATGSASSPIRRTKWWSTRWPATRRCSSTGWTRRAPSSSSPASP